MSDRDNILSSPCSCGSGKPRRECHVALGIDAHPEASDPGPATPPQGSPGTMTSGTVSGAISGTEVAPSPGQSPQIARSPVTRRLDLAGGQNVRLGFEGVDIWPGAQHVVDLQRYPWPFEDESVLELNCSHYIEHIPMETISVMQECPGCQGLGVLINDRTCPVCRGDLQIPTGIRKDSLFAFFDECWRILVPDGWLFITVPSHRNDRAFQDPTHRRFITQQTFAYTNEDWRRANKLDHYNADCNFIGECNPVVDQSLTLRHPDVAQQRILHQWNTVIDWTAKLQKKPRLPPRM